MVRHYVVHYDSDWIKMKIKLNRKRPRELRDTYNTTIEAVNDDHKQDVVVSTSRRHCFCWWFNTCVGMGDVKGSTGSGELPNGGSNMSGGEVFGLCGIS